MRLTSSAIEKAFLCGLPFADPAAEYDDGPVHPKTQDGTDFHALAAAHIDGVCDAVPNASPRARELYAAWLAWWHGFSGDLGWRSETPVAFDVTTRRARFLPSSGQRDYSAARPSELPGTIDAWALHDRCVLVGDFKSGNPIYVTSARRNKQLAFGALCLARIFGLDDARVFLALTDERGVSPDEHTLDCVDLDATEHEVCVLFASLPAATPRPWTRADVGHDHCRYCAMRRSGRCPSRAA